jgi:uncharacterized protein (DUF2147 family)
MTKNASGLRMRRFLFLALGTFFLSGIPGAMGGSPSILGEWLRTDGQSRIHIAPCGAHLCAVNTWVSPRSGELVGDRLVLRVQPRETAQLAGEAFDERRRLTYSLLIAVDNDSMTTQGCVLGGIACRTMNWTRPH